MEQLTLQVKKTFTCDVLVLGGGPAGIAAAIKAAEGGADTILADQNGYLGGTATAGLVGPFMTSYNARGERQLIRGFFERIVRRMEAAGGAVHPSNATLGTSYTGYRVAGHQNLTAFDYEVLKKTSEQMCEEAGVRLMYHLFFVKTDVENGVIKSAYFATKQGIYKISAKIFIDCSGDADMAFDAGVPTVFGDGEGSVQSSSLFFTVRGIDKEAMDRHMAESPDMETKFYMREIAEERAKGNYPLWRHKILIFEGFHGEWIANMTQLEDVDGTDPEQVTSAEITCRKQIDYILAFLRKYVAGCQNVTLARSASTLGVRESRRIVGEYETTLEDVTNSVKFQDSILCCSNTADIHKKELKDHYGMIHSDHYFIPYRALLPKKIDNLLVAGRCVAGERIVVSAIRVMPPCFGLGEAAGTAAALTLRNNCTPKTLDTGILVKKLVEDGVYLEG